MKPKEIKDARSKKKMTQAELAAALGVTVTTVARWETGKCEPSPLAEQRLREVLAVRR
jgi:DNA-binding transcriptional regulator YiaG